MYEKNVGMSTSAILPVYL